MSGPTNQAVFLSYASQDAAAAKRICDALRAAGVEVWFDQSELRGGDSWDQKIRRQIKDCALFIPVVSANTQARREGYFRLEWKLADDRTHLMAKGTPFIVPVCVDDTKDWEAIVPDSFTTVQWTRLPVRQAQGSEQPGGEGASAFGERVKALLAGEPRTEGGGRRADNGRQTAEGGRRRSTGIRIVVAIAAVAVLAFWRPWRFAGKNAPPPVASTAIALPATAPKSEARQLAAKAQAMFDALDSTRDDHRLAEELVQQARAKDPMDAEVLATESLLHQRFIQRGWDTSETRREAARAAAQRALRLDPQSYEVRFAQAGLLAYMGREGEEKERQLRALRSERPADRRVLRMLGSTIERQGRIDEGVPFMDEAAALPGGDPLALYNKSQSFWFFGRLAEAEAALEASLAQKPFTGAKLMAVWYATVLHGDLAKARAILAELPTRELQEDRAAFFAFNVEFLARRYGAARSRLNAVPRDWLNDGWYRGPKGLLLGDTYRAEGRPEAALVEWRAALTAVNDRLAASPRDTLLLYRRALLLARLGERAEAERQASALLQLSGANPAGDKPVPPWVTDLSVELGRHTDAIRQISVSLKQERHAVDFTAADLRLNPLWDPLRREPDFDRVIAEAEARETADLRVAQKKTGSIAPPAPPAPKK